MLFVIRELSEIKENHEGSHKQLQRLPNPQMVGPLRVVSGQEEVLSEGDSLTSVRSPISQLPQGAEGPGFAREPLGTCCFTPARLLR